MKINPLSILKCIYGPLKIFFLSILKRITADIGLINRHTFGERALFFLTELRTSFMILGDGSGSKGKKPN